MEWLDDLFTMDAQAVQFRPDDAKAPHSSAATIKQSRDDLSGVLRELMPDVIVIVEGPSRPKELQKSIQTNSRILRCGSWIPEMILASIHSLSILIMMR
jgi:hypothetical protein